MLRLGLGRRGARPPGAEESQGQRAEKGRGNGSLRSLALRKPMPRTGQVSWGRGGTEAHQTLELVPSAGDPRQVIELSAANFSQP